MTTADAKLADNTSVGSISSHSVSSCENISFGMLFHFFYISASNSEICHPSSMSEKRKFEAQNVKPTTSIMKCRNSGGEE